MELLFWSLLGLIFYAYLGYGMVLSVLVLFKRNQDKTEFQDLNELPEVTLFIASYNEIDFLAEKLKNTFELDYPKDKLRILFITDGSNDGSYEYLSEIQGVEVNHIPQRGGKIGAMNRGMSLVKTPITIFCDANTILSKNTIKEIVLAFTDPNVGCVSGEKSILQSDEENASGAGEGIYWKYESKLKAWDSEIGSVVGAAGELFAIRTALFEEVEKDTLLDDFMISMRIAKRGYKVKYVPQAQAKEKPTENVKEEFKRKIRICAGGIQSVIRLKALLNPFRYGMLSFQYISHRVLRWTIVPVALLAIFPINLYLTLEGHIVYKILLIGQVLFYLSSFMGWIFENRKIKFKPFFIPYYFFVMNYSVFLGFRRFLKGNQTVLWEKAKRA